MSSRRRPTKKSSINKGDLQFYEFLFGSPARNVAILAAAVAALFYLNGTLFRPIYESGPPPFPARKEVDQLRDETNMSFDSIRKNVNEQTEVIKQITQKAAQDAAETRASRVTRLIAQRTTLTSLVEMNPNDQTLKNLLENTNAQLIQLQVEIARDAGIQQQQLPPVLK